MLQLATSFHIQQPLSRVKWNLRHSAPYASRDCRQVLAAAGVASRRAAEELVVAGDVSVNGATVLVPQTLVDAQRDEVQALSAQHGCYTSRAAWFL